MASELVAINSVVPVYMSKRRCIRRLPNMLPARASYWRKRVRLMQTWADVLDHFKKLAATGRRAA
jgi:hypothetical protein